jgi:hypothetical protein
VRVALVGLALVATACGGSSGGDASVAPDPCSNATATSVPASCIPGEGNFTAVPSQSGTPPVSSAAIPAVVNPPEPGELARGGNDKDPSVLVRRFTVTLPAGERLRTTLACQGAHSIVLTTTPKSAAEQEFTCDYAAPAQLSVEDSVPASAPTSYVVTVKVQAPARWYVVISGTKTPVPKG